MSQTRTQKYAGKAMEVVKGVAARPEEQRKEYKSRADSGPTMVMQAGLTQTLGFLRGKRGVYENYANDIATVIGEDSAETLHTAAIESDLPRYRRLTRQVLEAAGLIKRFAQIELAKGRENGKAAASDPRSSSEAGS
ncbi:MAG TPA: type III-B CRISPR module-associated protein Cmr5 [Xanthomonadales bacterium]|nr:type III-B CRISPR module-associated protein Cmr5 [Xanthomonadales bacterium]